MSLCQDRQIKGFLLFLTLFALLFVGTATVLTIYQVNDAEVLWLKHDEAVSSSLLETPARRSSARIREHNSPSLKGLVI